MTESNLLPPPLFPSILCFLAPNAGGAGTALPAWTSVGQIFLASRLGATQQGEISVSQVLGNFGGGGVKIVNRKKCVWL